MFDVVDAEPLQWGRGVGVERESQYESLGQLGQDEAASG